VLVGCSFSSYGLLFIGHTAFLTNIHLLVEKNVDYLAGLSMNWYTFLNVFVTPDSLLRTEFKYTSLLLCNHDTSL